MQRVAFFTVLNERFSPSEWKLRNADISVEVFSVLHNLESALLTGEYRLCVIRCDGRCDVPFHVIDFFQKHRLRTQVIVSASAGTVSDAVELMKAGVSDFLIGGLDDPRLLESVLKTVTGYRGTATETAPATPAGDEDLMLIGQSSSICEIRSAVSLVAKSQTTVLITGESGTGKEVVARLIHRQSTRSQQQFIPLNCATLPKDVIENELFGHEKGAFTGALLKKAGCFELANGGTLFFDEVAEMSGETQAKLLRAIETQKFRRLGGKEEVRVDVRMVAATNKNVTAALASKELREDLYYRLSVIEIFIPPLRERKEDIPLLLDYFLALFAEKYAKPRQQFDQECMQLFATFDWPGNVREIRNVVERAIVICPHEVIGSQYLPERMRRSAAAQPAQRNINIPLGSSSQEAERILILQTLASAGNNKAKAAKILGLSRKTLHNKLTGFSQS